MTPAERAGKELPNNDEVICPNCVHQFRAIPVNVQTRIAELEAALAERTQILNDAVRSMRECEVRMRAAEADAERLDWLAANPREATVRVGGDMKIAVFWGVSAAPGTTMRAAIDAARAQELQR